MPEERLPSPFGGCYRLASSETDGRDWLHGDGLAFPVAEIIRISLEHQWPGVCQIILRTGPLHLFAEIATLPEFLKRLIETQSN